MKRILITGVSGLLGVNLALEASKHHQVFGVVNTHPLKTDAFEVIKANLLEEGALEQLLARTKPDWVIHCAALANLEECEKDPDLAHRLNSEVPEKLARLVGRGGARLIHVSTDAVFDGQRGNYTEEDTPNPINVYSQTKLAGEQRVLAVNPEAIVARVNLFGWSVSGKRSLAEFFFNNLSMGRKVMGFTDVFFCPLLANDLADIFLKMLEQGLRGLYHVVSSGCITKYEFGVAIARQFGFDADLIEPTSVTESGLKAARSPLLTLRVDKLIRDLGEVPPRISPAIERFYTLYQQGYPQHLAAMASKTFRE